MFNITLEKDLRNATWATLPLRKTGTKGESMIRAQIPFFLPAKKHTTFTDKNGSELSNNEGHKIHCTCANVDRKMQNFKILCSRITANNPRTNLFW